MITLDHIQDAYENYNNLTKIDALAEAFDMPKEWVDKHSNSDWASEVLQ